MKAGGGKQKGTDFERQMCTKLSLWVSHGNNKDLFWRSAMSGGRATIALRSGRKIKPAGDICAVHEDGHIFTDYYLVDCKHYKDLNIDRFIIGSGMLFNFWTKLRQQAKDHGRKPMLVARQNNFPILMLLEMEWVVAFPMIAVVRDTAVCLFEEVMATRFREPPKQKVPRASLK